MNPTPGQGRGMGFGRGRGGRRGWHHQFYATGQPFWARTAVPEAAPPNAAVPVERQAQMLKAQAEQIQQALDQIHSRIEALEAAQSKEG